jgi:hypothetical protein
MATNGLGNPWQTRWLTGMGMGMAHHEAVGCVIG